MFIIIIIIIIPVLLFFWQCYMLHVAANTVYENKNLSTVK